MIQLECLFLLEFIQKAYEKLNEQINWNNVRKKNLWKMIIEQKFVQRKQQFDF